MKKIQSKPIRLLNPLNKEVWICPDYTKIQTVDGIEYVTVHRPETPQRKHLMRKDALRRS